MSLLFSAYRVTIEESYEPRRHILTQKNQAMPGWEHHDGKWSPSRRAEHGDGRDS